MKIKAINSNVKSMKLNVPIDGLIDIDANGIAVVSDKAAEVLVKGTNDWKYAEEVNPTTEASQGESNSENVTDDDIIAGIKKMKLADMITTANEAGYPAEEWERFAKKEKLMAAYLIKKYNEAKLAEVTE
jgi:hypothetical protein